MKTYKIFLDDDRLPVQCANYMHRRIGKFNPVYLSPDWVISRDYEHFTHYITNHGLPEIASLDHDLADEHYKASVGGEFNYNSFKEKTGYHAMVWLANYCLAKGVGLPTIFIHTMNPVGYEKINSIIHDFHRMEKSA